MAVQKGLDHNPRETQSPASIEMSLALATAEKIAAKIVYELEPFCSRIEVAGSIRRRRPNVNDIDLVVIPKPPHEQALRERCKKRAKRVQTDAEQTLVVILDYPPNGVDGLELDIWIARPPGQDLFERKPTNFGTLFLMRTGSRQHNIHLITQAQSLGYRWNPYHGVFDGHGKCLACETEEEIFTALKLKYVEPEKREI